METNENVSVEMTLEQRKAEYAKWTKPYKALFKGIQPWFKEGAIKTGTDFENHRVDFLRLLGFTAEHVGGAHDCGVDIIASIHIQGVEHKFLIQCKYYNKPLGKEPIQQIFAGAHFMRSDAYKVVMTNNDVTFEARQFAHKLGVEIISHTEMELFNHVGRTGELPAQRRTGLLGILIGIIIEDPKYMTFAVKKHKNAPPDTKEKLVKQLTDEFDEAEECTREAARLQQRAADYAQRALHLQKEALLKNLEYI